MRRRRPLPAAKYLVLVAQDWFTLSDTGETRYTDPVECELYPAATLDEVGEIQRAADRRQLHGQVVFEYDSGRYVARA